MDTTLADWDDIVLLSFGGPEHRDEVMPFLRRVTAGRGVPEERLLEVAHHYWYHFDGCSPINAQNRALLAALQEAAGQRGWRPTIHWANRNAAPFVEDVLPNLGDRVLVVTTSVFPGYSSCRQYLQDIERARRDQQVRKVVPLALHPGYIEAVADRVAEVMPGPDSRILYCTHSIPVSAAAQAGPGGGQYVAWHEALQGAVDEVLADRGITTAGSQIVYCSRSGPPRVPWLEPDVNDHLRDLVAEGVTDVVCVPFGFVSDHMEVAHDLDIEAATTAAQLGITWRRAGTVGLHPRFLDALCDGIEAAAGGQPPALTVPAWAACEAWCCPEPGRPR